MRVTFLLGTRPEITKTIGIISTLSSRGEIPVGVVFTGQQTDLVKETIDDFREFESVCAEWAGNSQSSMFDPDWKQRVSEFFSSKGLSHEVGLVVGTGDTNSVLVGSEVAKTNGIPFLHLEAGIRHKTDHDLEPEEFNRRRISPLASYHFCPSAVQRSNLLAEGIDEETIYVAGDLSRVSVSTTWKRLARDKKFGSESIVAQHFDYRRKLCLCTFHRSTSLTNIDALEIRIRDLVWYHPNVNFLVCVRPDTRWRNFNKQIAKAENVELVPAPRPFAFQQLLAITDVVLTDSAGVQQEAALLRKPCVALRKNFELGFDDPLLQKVEPPFRDLHYKFLVAAKAAHLVFATNISQVRQVGDAMANRIARMIEQLVVTKRLLVERQRPTCDQG